MSRIFISHSSRDNPKAAALRDWLVAHGWDDLFLDFDPRRGMVAGERWQLALRQAADRCEAVICMLSDAWLASDWCENEARMAWRWGKRIIGVLIDDLPSSRIPSWMSAEWQHVNLAAPGEHASIETTVPPDDAPHTVSFHVEGLERLRLGLEKAGLAAGTFVWPPQHDPGRAPYRGLRPLEAEDAGIFFGRDAQTVNALDELRNLREKGLGCLFVIQGASGAGKSSFLRAGLLPRLRRDDRHFLPLPVIRPERAALTGESGLVAALDKACAARKLGIARADLRRDVEQGAAAVASRLTALQAAVPIVTPEGEVRPPPPTIVMPIDQGEELFATTSNGEGGRFLQLMADLLTGPPHMIVAIAVRSESYRHLQQYHLPHGVRRVPFDLPPVHRGAYQEIIEGPAAALPRARRLEIAPALTERLLSDLERGSGADPLPLLAFTLERLYAEYGQSGRLELANYEALGGLSGSIAEAVNGAIKDAQAKGAAPAQNLEAFTVLRHAFIPWLCRIDPVTRAPLRRVTRLDDIPADARGLVDELVNRRLLVSSIRKNDDGSQETVIDIAHESLLRQWPLLRGWLEQETGVLLILEGVQRAAMDWVGAKKGDASLLLHRGGRLEDALAISTRSDMAAALSDQDKSYLDACREAEVKQRRTRRRLRVLAAVTSLIAVMAFVMFDQMRDSWKLVSFAIAQQAQEANDEHDYAKGLLLALAGLPEQGAVFWPDQPYARVQLLRAFQSHPLLKILQHRTGGVVYAGFSSDGMHVVTASADGTARLWEPERDKALHVLPRSPEGANAAFLPGGRRMFNVYGRAQPMMADIGDIGYAAKSSSVLYSAVSSDGSHALTVSGDKVVQVWNLTACTETACPAIVLSGHDFGVSYAVFSPGNKRVFTVSASKTARLLNAETGELVHAFEGDAGVALPIVNQADFSPDGRRVVTAHADGTARLWNAETGETLRVFEIEGNEDAVTYAAFSPDGRRVLTASGDMTARLWDAETGRPLAVLNGHEKPVVHAAFSPDGRRVLTASGDKTARLWDAKTGEMLNVLEGHEDAVTHAVFSRDGSRALTASADNTARHWNTRTGQRLHVLRGHTGPVRHVALSDDGERAITASDDGTARLWNLTGESHTPLRKGHEGPVVYTAFSPDGKQVVTTAGDKTARLWDAKTGQLRHTLFGHKDAIPFAADRQFVLHASFSPDGAVLVTASVDGTARLWNTSSGRLLHVLAGHTGAVYHAGFSPDGKRILTASEDMTARMWTAKTGKHLREFKGHTSKVSDAAFSPDGRRVVTASDDMTALLWDAETGRQLHVFAGHEDRLSQATFSPDGTRVLTASWDGTARMWDAETDRPARVYKGHSGGINSAVFSPDGERILTASWDKTARLWNASSGRLLLALEGNDGPVRSAAFSPDGAYVLTASWDKTARLWDAATGRLLHVFAGHEDRLSHAAFAPNGKQVVTASWDKTARLWQLPGIYFRKPGEQVIKACEMVRRVGDRFTPVDMTNPLLLSRGRNPCERPGLLSWRYYRKFLPDFLGGPQGSDQ